MRYPAGRLGLREFFDITGISKTTFYGRYRKDPSWIQRLDLRKGPDDCLHVCAKAAQQLAEERKGVLALAESARADALLRRCPHCDELIRRKARVCKHCRRDVVPGEPNST